MRVLAHPARPLARLLAGLLTALIPLALSTGTATAGGPWTVEVEDARTGTVTRLTTDDVEMTMLMNVTRVGWQDRSGGPGPSRPLEPVATLTWRFYDGAVAWRDRIVLDREGRTWVRRHEGVAMTGQTLDWVPTNQGPTLDAVLTGLSERSGRLVAPPLEVPTSPPVEAPPTAGAEPGAAPDRPAAGLVALLAAFLTGIGCAALAAGLVAASVRRRRGRAARHPIARHPDTVVASDEPLEIRLDDVVIDHLAVGRER